MNKTARIFFEYLYFLCLIAVALVLTFERSFQSAVIEGISLWFACILPALFPFSVITALLSASSVTGKLATKVSPLTSKLFRINGSVGYAFFMSVISGYPMGAKLVSDLKTFGALSDAESVRASVLCSTSSLTFTLVSVGSIMFSSIKFGGLVLASHILSTIIVGLCFALYKKDSAPKPFNLVLAKRVDGAFYNSVYSSVLSTLTVGGIITVFYLLTEILYAYKILQPLIFVFSKALGNNGGKALALGLFECTKGLKVLSSVTINDLSLPIACFLVSFGGLSVLMQSVSFLKKAKIKTAPFIISKLLSAVLSFVLGLIFNAIFY